MKNNIIAIALLVIAVGAGGFFAGLKYQQTKQSSFGRQFVTQGGRNGGQFQGVGGNTRMGFRPVSGEIISSDDKSITVKLQDGTSKIVILSGNTQINKASEASKEELKAGEQVAVFGTENSDGSVTAVNIQLNPIRQEVSGGN